MSKKTGNAHKKSIKKYNSLGSYIKNKILKLLKHLKLHPNDVVAKTVSKKTVTNKKKTVKL